MENKECSNLKAYYFRTKNTVSLYFAYIMIPEDKIDMNTPIIEWSPGNLSFYMIREVFFRYKDFAYNFLTSMCKENVNKMHIYMNPTLKILPGDKHLEGVMGEIGIHICKLFNDADEIGYAMYPNYDNYLSIMCNLQRCKDIIMERFDDIIRALIGDISTNKQRIKVIYHFSDTGRCSAYPDEIKYTTISHYVRIGGSNAI